MDRVYRRHTLRGWAPPTPISVRPNLIQHLTECSELVAIHGLASRRRPTPRIDGRIKPDICAPGVEVISAYNRHNFDSSQLESIVSYNFFGGKYHYYGAASGTSMASPHVAGMVALMLQANDSLEAKDIIEIFKITARADSFTGAVPNKFWGWGKLNAYAAMLLAQAPLSTGSFEKPDFRIYPNPSTGNIEVYSSFDVHNSAYAIIDMQGRMVIKGLLQSSSHELNLPAGIYWLSIEKDGISNREKLVVIQ